MFSYAIAANGIGGFGEISKYCQNRPLFALSEVLLKSYILYSNLTWQLLLHLWHRGGKLWPTGSMWPQSESYVAQRYIICQV